MPVILWKLNRRRARSGTRPFGVPPLEQTMPLPLPTVLRISGVTKDSTGAVLGGCVVELFRTGDDVRLETVTSDPTTGAYSFSATGLAQDYFVVAYKAGAPDVAGTTVNTLAGA